jgi:hypothetical protein
MHWEAHPGQSCEHGLLLVPRLLQVLLEALLNPGEVPLPRLTAVLAIIEGRSDLKAAVAAAGPHRFAAAVLRSDGLQRLLPDGLLLEAALELVSGTTHLRMWSFV